MEITSSVAYWLLLIFLQFAPVQEMEIGDYIMFTNNDLTYEITLSDIPVEDYWEVTLNEYTGNEFITKYVAAGYSQPGSLMLFSLIDYEDSGGTGNGRQGENLFSVNEAGGPFIFGGEDGNPWDFIYLSTDQEFVIPFQDNTEFHFKGGIDHTGIYYSELPGESMKVEITFKQYTGNNPALSNVKFIDDTVGIDLHFWREYK